MSPMVDAWELVAAVAPRLGITEEAMRKARERRRIPYRWRSEIWAEAHRRGASVNPASFTLPEPAPEMRDAPAPAA